MFDSQNLSTRAQGVSAQVKDLTCAPYSMNPKALALLSGGLDSTLAVCILKEQGIEIEAVYFQTMFGCCKNEARQVAHQLGVPFTLLQVRDDYLGMIKKPKYGYGRGINPCVDCRGYMFDMAKQLMKTTGASFLISGEVLGQRPMSQKMKDFQRIEADCELEGLIVRPLSALKLPETLPEKAGIVDRSKLFGIEGRSRLKILELAAQYGVHDPPSPSAGCALTSPDFAKKVRDVFLHSESYKRWEFEILKIGRHFRLSRNAKVIVARNQNQNEYMELLRPEGTALLSCKNFGGPHALIIGSALRDYRDQAAQLMFRYSQKPLPEECQIQYEEAGENELFFVRPMDDQRLVDSMRIV